MFSKPGWAQGAAVPRLVEDPVSVSFGFGSTIRVRLGQAVRARLPRALALLLIAQALEVNRALAAVHGIADIIEAADLLGKE